MSDKNKNIKDILIASNFITAEEVEKAALIAEQQKVPLSEYVVAANLLTKDLVGQAFAEHFKVGYADLNSVPPPHDQVLIIPEESARMYRAVTFRQSPKSVDVATDDPTKEGIIEALQPFFPKKKIQLLYGNTEDIDNLFVHYRQELSVRLKALLAEGDRIAPQILDEVFRDALTLRASDVHLEPRDDEAIVRFRVDGAMREMARIPKRTYDMVVNRIKVLSHLRTDEHFAAQDGALRYHLDDASVDVRVSVAPTVDGEKIVMRLLAAYVRGFTLLDLGLAEIDQKMLITSAEKPFGMILVVGPTGSGKTTTLYGLLKYLNQPDVNLTTIEDPVEYKISGVNHIQVNHQTHLTFAQGLRSIVRQDPDVILVGEIRDLETAEIAVNASLTGHLLLSTFHANDAATAVPRLLDMGVEPFLLASTMELIIAQRLVRRLCESCRFGVETKSADIKEKVPNAEKWFGKKSVTLYSAKGCSACGGTGYKGRIAVFEMLQVTAEMEELILSRPSTKRITELAMTQGMRGMFADGIDKVRAGITSLDELLRVVQAE
jgi:type II secretory ATPase GspE/PulE/Tfp pilus assembly ATPase PilB-like protein